MCLDGGERSELEPRHMRWLTPIYRNIFTLPMGSAHKIMKGYEIFYNFIRKHQAIDCCPYELATEIKLNNPNKWLELIGMSKNVM